MSGQKEIASRSEWTEIVGGIRGLDGLDKEEITYESLDDPKVKQRYQTV